MNPEQLQNNLIEEKVSSESEVRSDYELVSKKNKLSPLIIYVITSLLLIAVVAVLVYFFFFAN